MLIGVDKAQKKGKHELKHSMLQEDGNELFFMPIPVGDYIKITPEIEDVIKRRGNKLSKMDTIGLIDVSIDTKRDMEELYSCLVQDHSRFSDSCFLAYNNGIKLIILVENENGVTDVNSIDVWRNEKRWKSYYAAVKRAKYQNKKLPKEPVKPSQLKKTMWTMNKKYGVIFMFCHPLETADVIKKLLNSEGVNDICLKKSNA